MTFAGRTAPPLSVQVWLFPRVPALYQVGPPPAQAPGKVNAERPGTSLGHPASIQPLASASRLRLQTGGPRTQPDPRKDRGVILAPTGFKTNGIPCLQISIKIQTSRVSRAMGPLSYRTMNPRPPQSPPSPIVWSLLI